MSIACLHMCHPDVLACLPLNSLTSHSDVVRHGKKTWLVNVIDHFLQVNPNIKKEKWSLAEDERLLVLYEEHGGSWAQISRHLEVSYCDDDSNCIWCIPGS